MLSLKSLKNVLMTVDIIVIFIFYYFIIICTVSFNLEKIMIICLYSNIFILYSKICLILKSISKYSEQKTGKVIFINIIRKNHALKP